MTSPDEVLNELDRCTRKAANRLQAMLTVTTAERTKIESITGGLPREEVVPSLFTLLGRAETMFSAEFQDLLKTLPQLHQREGLYRLIAIARADQGYLSLFARELREVRNELHGREPGTFSKKSVLQDMVAKAHEDFQRVIDLANLSLVTPNPSDPSLN